MAKPQPPDREIRQLPSSDRKRTRALDPKQIEKTSEADRRWFEKHPHRHAMIRPPQLDELELGPCHQVLVIQLAASVRVRLALTAGDFIDHDDFMLWLGIRVAPIGSVRSAIRSLRKRLAPVFIHPPGRA